MSNLSLCIFCKLLYNLSLCHIFCKLLYNLSLCLSFVSYYILPLWHIFCKLLYNLPLCLSRVSYYILSLCHIFCNLLYNLSLCLSFISYYTYNVLQYKHKCNLSSHKGHYFLHPILWSWPIFYKTCMWPKIGNVGIYYLHWKFQTRIPVLYSLNVILLPTQKLKRWLCD
jgi:hypothetical protein